MTWCKGALKYYEDFSSRLYNKTYYYTGLPLYNTSHYNIYNIYYKRSCLLAPNQVIFLSFSDVNNFIINTVSLITQSISMDPKDSVIMR